jgi:hypothetical protein
MEAMTKRRSAMLGALVLVLNDYFDNDDPPEEEVKRLNDAPAFSP